MSSFTYGDWKSFPADRFKLGTTSRYRVSHFLRRNGTFHDVPSAVRSARSSDAAEIWRLLCQYASSYSPDPNAFERNLLTVLNNPDVILLVIESADLVVGYLLAFKLTTLFANESILEVIELCVDESARGVGYGSKLVTEAVEEAWMRGCVEVVVPSRRAGPFYERLGFAPTAKYYKLRRMESQ